MNDHDLFRQSNINNVKNNISTISGSKLTNKSFWAILSSEIL